MKECNHCVLKESYTVDELEIQRLRSDISFGEINLVNTLKLRDQTLIPDFTLLIPNHYIVATG